ncbi:FMN-binding protein [Arthrobacter sp. A2-55]|uniref:FMN-binding protein n=1 Tax=Arthrobacter sp. A2-55 TaxID=2897337 RepID=UPI0021CD3ADD|nr:FMN-binding protein [Arthrobacter sp. A2-55]MCU6479694.1 FMN-binding protein [Arthrobacter sp. A2-55]
MRARSAVLASLASAAILLIGWQAGNQASSTPGGTVAKVANPPSGAGTSSGSGGSTAAGTGAGNPAPAAGAKSGTFDGSQIQTPYGTVQVRAVITGGKITDIVALQLTDVGSLSGEIDQQAVPMLRSEVLSSQSAKVDMVGGATYTSQGYLSSLQAALDAANFKG